MLTISRPVADIISTYHAESLRTKYPIRDTKKNSLVKLQQYMGDKQKHAEV